LTTCTFSLGAKRYELSNHLGNVLAVVSDRKIMVDKGTYSGGYYVNATLDNKGDLYDPEYYNFGMYYAFGAPMPGTTYAKSKSYRYGFNGMEKESDVYGEGNAYTTEYRMMDVRLGKWFSRDMVVKPWESPYAVNRNSPLYLIDPLGLDPVKPWNYVQRLFHKDFKVRANKVAAENNVDEKNVNYNEVDPNTDQKYASVQLGYKSVESNDDELHGGVNVKKFWDGKRLKERPLSFFERLDRRVNSWKGRPGDEVMSWEPAWMRPGHHDPVHSAPDAAGVVVTAGGSLPVYGFYNVSGGIFFGFSRKDGFNAGYYDGGGGGSGKEPGIDASIMAASGDFTWDNYSGDGTTYTIGTFVSGSYGHGGDPTNIKKSPFQLKGMTFSSSPFNLGLSITKSHPLF
jgi:RHS repeat-associated protein